MRKAPDRRANLFHGMDLHMNKSLVLGPPQSSMKVKGQRSPPYHPRLCMSLRMGNVTFPAHSNFYCDEIWASGHLLLVHCLIQTEKFEVDHRMCKPGRA